LGTYFVPGTTGDGAELVNEAWQLGIEAAVYEDAQLFPLLSERDRLYNKLHIRKYGNFSTSTLSSTANPASVTYGTATTSEVTVSPVAQYVATQLSRNQIKQMNVDLTQSSEFKASMNKALAQKIDQYVNTQLIQPLTTNVVGDAATTMDRALVLNLLYTIRKNAKSAVQPGKSDIKFIVWPLQGPSFMSIPEFTAANLRGDSANPNVKGIVFEAMGLEFIVSGNLDTTGGAVSNPMFVKDAFALSWNERPTVFSQEYELASRIYCYANYGASTVWDDRAGNLKTKATL
jgi:hypothetical protein